MTLAEALAGNRPLPWLFELAAELENESPADLYTDAGVLSRSLSGAADLFDLPAVCVSFDTTLEAEAVGCTVGGDGDAVRGIVSSIDDAFDVPLDDVSTGGRAPVVVDAAGRLAETCTASVLGGVTGPALLARHLLVDPDGADEMVAEEAMFTAGELCVELANAYLDAGADGVALLEPAGLDAPFYDEAAEPIANVLAHYEAQGVIVTEHATEADVRTGGEVGFDAITGAVDDPEAALDVATEAGIALGVGLARETFAAGSDAVADARDDVPAGAFASSEWVVPAGTAPEAVHELMGTR